MPRRGSAVLSSGHAFLRNRPRSAGRKAGGHPYRRIFPELCGERAVARYLPIHPFANAVPILRAGRIYYLGTWWIGQLTKYGRGSGGEKQAEYGNNGRDKQQ